MPDEKKPNPSTSQTSSHTAPTRNPDWESYAPEGHGRTDEQIRADVHQVLSRASPAQGAVAVTVEDGLVTLTGEFEDASYQQRVREQIRKVPSVRKLQDRSTLRGA